MLLSRGAFTGSKDKGNPYQGDMEKGIAYDVCEATAKKIVEAGRFPVISSPYRAGAQKLLEYFPKGCANVIDIGSGTGIATLEILLQGKAEAVLGVEISSGMMEVAKYKFHQSEGKNILDLAQEHKDSEDLLKYWKNFKQESRSFASGDRVKFVQGDIQTFALDESFEGSFANQVMHWTNIDTSFANIAKLLKRGGVLLWNSASHFYNDKQFPSIEFGFRYNDFVKFVLDDVCKSGKFNAIDYHELSKPLHNLETITNITRNQGLDTKQVSTFLVPVDLQTFIQNQLPACIKSCVETRMKDSLDKMTETTKKEFDDSLNHSIQEAISRAIVNPKALKDMEHKYDIAPIFLSTKI